MENGRENACRGLYIAFIGAKMFYTASDNQVPFLNNLHSIPVHV